MPDFNLADMSLAELRDLQKSVAKAISTFEARHKAVAREKVECNGHGYQTICFAQPLQRVCISAKYAPRLRAENQQLESFRRPQISD